jgi:hypothetical protein
VARLLHTAAYYCLILLTYEKPTDSVGLLRSHHTRIRMSGNVSVIQISISGSRQPPCLAITKNRILYPSCSRKYAQLELQDERKIID